MMREVARRWDQDRAKSRVMAHWNVLLATTDRELRYTAMSVPSEKRDKVVNKSFVK
jgi:hypothetical protein